MNKKITITISALMFLAGLQTMSFATGKVFSSAIEMPLLAPKVEAEEALASHVMPLGDRYPVASVNDVFRDNILLTLHYMAGTVKSPSDIHWDEIRKPFKYEFVLKPGEVFAYHDGVLPAYQGKVKATTNAHFNAQEGFLSDGYLFGDGVCHFASLINWVGQDAGLKVESRVSHDFANIPDVPREYGTSIYADPGESYNEQMQNLYIENNLDKTVKFVFQYEGDELTVNVYEVK